MLFRHKDITIANDFISRLLGQFLWFRVHTFMLEHSNEVAIHIYIYKHINKIIETIAELFHNHLEGNPCPQQSIVTVDKLLNLQLFIVRLA